MIITGGGYSEAMERLGVHDHLCLIYEKREEQFAAVVPFIRIGLQRGEKCFYIVDDNTADAVLSAMRSGGIDAAAASAAGALTLFTKADSYLKDGYFSPDRMIQVLKEATDRARQEGYSALRITGEMTWVLGGDPGVERLMEYEAKLNYFFPENDALAICQYNRGRFSPEIITGVIHTHPRVIFGGLACRNFYYVPPDEFLRPNHSSRQVERLLNTILERERIEERMRERSVELEKKNAELETMLKGFVNRESRMVEMKKKIDQLEQRLASMKRPGAA